MKLLSLADKFIIGFMIITGMAETGHLFMVFGHRPFSDAVKLILAEMAMGVLFCPALVLWKRMRGDRRKQDGIRIIVGKRQKGVGTVTAAAFILFILCFLYQTMTITSGERLDRRGDMTVETVESILQTGSVYEINPLTGSAYNSGVPFRIRILGLPTLYALGCRLTGIPSWDLVTRYVPVIVLILGYLAFLSLAQGLFPDGKDRGKRMIFMAVVAFLLCVGDYAFGMDGYGLIGCGYRGTTIRSAILLPYVFGLCLKHRWKGCVLCVLAEACVVWTLYGMGSCLFITLGMGAVRFWQKQRADKQNLRAVGREV